MGARHALFRPFAVPGTVEIPESPRGRYGADRKTRQGRSRFCRAAVLRLRRKGCDNYLPRTIRSRCPGFGCGSAPIQAMTSAGPSLSPTRHTGRRAQSSATRNPGMAVVAVRRQLSTGANDRTSHASRRDGGSSWIGGERGGSDLLGRRTRRARMSFGLGGIARELIDLLLEDQRRPWSGSHDGLPLAGPHYLPHYLPHHL